eukprot:COSAG03_NODE_722_length_6101_cov_3031.874209_6_plen_73_part_00
MSHVTPALDCELKRRHVVQVAVLIVVCVALNRGLRPDVGRAICHLRQGAVPGCKDVPQEEDGAEKEGCYRCR